MAKQILVPIDLNQEGVLKSVLGQACAQATLHDAAILLLAVVPDLSAGAFPFVGVDYIDELVKEAQQRLEAIGHQWLDGKCAWQAKTVTGSVASQIIQAADDCKAELIVMASHNPRRSDIIFGSIADQVVKNAQHSILVVRQPASDQ